MLDLTYLYAHKGKPLRSHGFDEILGEDKIESRLIEGFSSPPSLFPVVVWRCTQACNLKCIHCYANSTSKPNPNELSTDEGKKLIDDLADSKVSTIVFAGGEPLCIDWVGNVRPNQFWLGKVLGNIRTETFLEIVKRNIRYVTLCMSGFQPAVLTDEELRAPYPQCYLTEAEITY